MSIELLLSNVETTKDVLPTPSDELILNLMGHDVDIIRDGVNCISRLKELVREGRCLIITEGAAYQADFDGVVEQEELELAHCSEDDCPCSEFN